MTLSRNWCWVIFPTAANAEQFIAELAGTIGVGEVPFVLFSEPTMLTGGRAGLASHYWAMSEAIRDQIEILATHSRYGGTVYFGNELPAEWTVEEVLSMTKDAMYTQAKEDGMGAWTVTHSIRLSTAQLILGVIAGILGITATVLGAAWWIIEPRLDKHIESRTSMIVTREIARAEQEQVRMRAEFYQLLTAEKEQRREQLNRIEADIAYIRQRIDALAGVRR